MSKSLISEIEAYLAESGLSEARFGWLSSRNSRLVERLRDGGRIWPETEARVREWMRLHHGRGRYPSRKAQTAA